VLLNGRSSVPRKRIDLPDTSHRTGQSTYLDDLESLQWLEETHLKRSTVFPTHYRCAILYGNEDCPNAIELYAKNDIRCNPAVFVLERLNDIDGYVHRYRGQLPQEKFLKDRPATIAEAEAREANTT
jgi:hypothetical protein